MNARYPNLELLEYKARVALSQDEEFLKIFEEKKRNNKYAYAEIDAVMFPQVWGALVLDLTLLKMEALRLVAAR